MRFRCCKCFPPPLSLFFENDTGQCPKCGAAGPMSIAIITDVHLIVFDAKGPIGGPSGRQLVACQPKREQLAMHKFDTFAASDDPRAVTCRSCMGTPAYRELARAYAELLRPTGQEGATGCC
jgi:hypothetical protein